MRFVDANYVEYQPTKWLTYDDVLLVPNMSRLTSRNDPRISLATRITSGIPMQMPLVSANMDTVTEGDMAVAMHKAGGIGILHRFYQIKYGDTAKTIWLNDIKKIAAAGGVPAFSIGLDPKDIDIVEEALKAIASVTGKKPEAIVCVDVAHAHTEMMYHHIKKLSLAYAGNIQIIAGNVATPMGAKMLVDAGAHAIKVGVGGGSVCSTRIINGHGIPNLTAISQIRRALHGMQSNATLIADGGVRNSGDIAKALAAGADCVMLGRLFAGTTEAAGKECYINPDPKADRGYFSLEDLQAMRLPNECDYKLMKLYRGQSSAEFNKELGKTNVTAEGVSMYVKHQGPVQSIITDLLGGVRSGLTYSGAGNLKDWYEMSTFVEITNAGQVESRPHGLIQ